MKVEVEKREEKKLSFLFNTSSPTASNMSQPQQTIPDMAASPIKTELEWELHLAEEFEVVHEADCSHLLEEFMDAKDRARDIAVATVALKEASASKNGKGKGRAAEEGPSALTNEQYACKMRSKQNCCSARGMAWHDP